MTDKIYPSVYVSVKIFLDSLIHFWVTLLQKKGCNLNIGVIPQIEDPATFMRSFFITKLPSKVFQCAVQSTI